MSKTKLEPCPFCGSASVRLANREGKFLGQNVFGVKKIIAYSYVKCNKCHARGGCVSSIIFKYEADGYEEWKKANKEAIEIWNTRQGADNGNKQ